MALALFDLDNTLLNGDSDHSWGMYLADIGVLDAVEQEEMQDYFYQQYLQGELDMQAFLEFQLAPLAKFPQQQLLQWRGNYVDTVVESMIQSGKPDLLEPHRKQGDDIVIITATNDFITRPIADRLGVANLIATTVEVIDGEFSGKSTGIPCYQSGKVDRLNQWLGETNTEFDERYFYSDSINDLPLLQLVDHPIAVTPDDSLRAHAENLHWKIID